MLIEYFGAGAGLLLVPAIVFFRLTKGKEVDCLEFAAGIVGLVGGIVLCVFGWISASGL